MSNAALQQPPKLPLRVAFVTHALSPHRLALMECVAENVADFRVFLSQAEDKLHNFPLQTGRLAVTLQRSLNWEHRFKNVHGYSDVSHVHMPYDTYQQLKRYGPDVVITTELGLRSILAALYRRRNPEVKLIVWATLSQRTEATRGRVRAWIRRWLVAKVDMVFVNGRGGEQYIRDIGYTGPLALVPYAIDEAPFRTVEYEPQPDTFRLLYTGQLIARKGLPAFCSILAAWCRAHPATQVTFTIVGDGEERGAIEAVLTPANLSITVFHRVQQHVLVQFHERADIFAFPTLGDEWGVVVNEALIAGRPVLGSRHSQAVTELVRDGDNGWTWDPDQDGSLYEVLSQVFSCTVDNLKTMSENARALVACVSPQVVANTVLHSVRRTTGLP